MASLLLFGVIGTINLALVAVPWVMKTCSISDKIQKLTSGLTKVAAIQGISPPMVTALEKKVFGFSGNTRRIWFIDDCIVYYGSDAWIVVIEKDVEICL